MYEGTSRDNRINVRLLNNDGGGFAERVKVAPGTTVEQLIRTNGGGGEPENYAIRVNREPATQDHVLQEGDLVTMTPMKVPGA